MSEYAGSALTLWFVNAAGTLNMGPDTRRFSIASLQQVADLSAAHDRVPYLVPMVVDYALTWNGVAQTAALGMAYAQQLAAGVSGTLICWPAGTASGQLEYIIPAYSLGLETRSVYSDVTTYDCAFKVTMGEEVFVGSMAVDGLLLEGGSYYWLFEDSTHLAWG